MSIKKLHSYIGHINIAEELEEDQLRELATRVKEQFDEDFESMTDWLESVGNGVELMKQEWNSKSFPWEGASNYKDPLLTQAAIQFGDKATLELLRPKDLITSEVVGRDAEGQKKARGERVSEAMNYQVNHEMNDWRGCHGRLLYTLPNVGTAFKKTLYDPVEEQCESHIVQYPDFVVNQATKSMEECRSFSHILDINANGVKSRVMSGLWLDQDLYSQPDEGDKKGDQGSNESDNVLHATDNSDRFIEQQTFFDLDGDGYEEPYVVTLHESSCKVVRIVARFDEQSIKVKVDGSVMSLKEAMDQQAQVDLQEFGGDELVELIGLQVPEPDIDGLELCKIVPYQNITKYGFIPAPDGTFLDFGYSHLLGAITQGINTTTNQLTDRGTLNNVGGGLLSKEFRNEQGINRLRIGEWKKTNVPAQHMANGVRPNPNQEPSPTLFQLNEKMTATGQQFLAVTDMSGRIQANTAPTTALAIIQEGMIPTSALFKRIIDAETAEFRVLYRLNQRTFDPQKYQEILDDPNADAQADFNAQGMDLIPTANAEQSSKMHRVQTAAIEMEQVPMVLQAGGNPLPIIKGYFEAIGSQNVERVFPEEGTMTEEEKKQVAAMTKAQEDQNKLVEMQLQILAREQDRLDRDTAAKVAKIGEEIKKIQAEALNTLAQAAKYAEEAESESLNNQLTSYSASLQQQQISIQKNLDDLLAIGATNDRGFTQSPAMQFRPGSAGSLQ